jgi:hypothetical protein
MRPEAFAAGFVGFLCLILVVALVIAILYLLTLHKALSRVSPRNRLMEPGLVWLSLIPFFYIVWAFFIATRIPDSLRNEFRDRGRDDSSDYGKGIGLASAILTAVSVPVNAFARVTPAFGIILVPVGLASLVLFILFWVKIAGYSNQLARLEYYDDDDDYDRDEDDYVKRRRRRPPPDAIRPDDPGRFQE